MVDTRVYGEDLCETFSTRGKKLLQEETNSVYGKSCIDLIEGFYANGKPYSRYTYLETEQDDEVANEQGTEIEQQTPIA